MLRSVTETHRIFSWGDNEVLFSWSVAWTHEDAITQKDNGYRDQSRGLTKTV